MERPADLRDIMRMADTIRAFHMAMMEAGFSEQESLMLLPSLSVPVLFALEKRRES